MLTVTTILKSSGGFPPNNSDQDSRTAVTYSPRFLPLPPCRLPVRADCGDVIYHLTFFPSPLTLLYRSWQTKAHLELWSNSSTSFLAPLPFSPLSLGWKWMAGSDSHSGNPSVGFCPHKRPAVFRINFLLKRFSYSLYWSYSSFSSTLLKLSSTLPAFSSLHPSLPGYLPVTKSTSLVCSLVYQTFQSAEMKEFFQSI